jgi:uncharacterized protein DUF4443
MQSLSRLLEIAERPVQGPSPSFEKPHLVLAFITIGESGIIGRQALAVRSGLKEGPVRTVLKKLREDGYAKTNASGCYLTDPGKRVYKSLRSRLSPFALLEGSKLTIGAYQVGIVARDGARAVQSGLEQRDSVIRLNALGATTFVIKGGKFVVPGGSSDPEKEFPSRDWSTLRERLDPKNGDAVVVCGAKDETTAKLGALSAALTLL